jgi:hypothetical protein
VTEPEEMAVLRQLAAAFPVPDGRWHAFSDEIHGCREDFAAALDVIAGDPAATAALLDALAGRATTRRVGDPALERAAARLAALPAPEGRHPFVDDIFPGLEGMHAALAALAASPAAASNFASRRPAT